MAKVHRPKLNSWILALILTSVGLHGLVLALPMPDLVKPLEEIPESPEPEIIQVVTLPRLATVPESPKPPLPPLPPPPSPPVEVPVIEKPPEELVLTDPEILDEIELDEIEPDIEEEDLEPEEPFSSEAPPPPDDPLEPMSLDAKIASRDSYSNYSNERVGGDGYVSGQLGDRFIRTGQFPSPLHQLARILPSIVVPLQDCLEPPPSDSITVVVTIDPDGVMVGDPETINSTGYEVLDEKALEIASAADYTDHYKAGELKEYSFAIKVDYEACGKASLSRRIYG